MIEKYSLKSKILLLISIIGFSGGFLVPLFGVINHKFWGETISGQMDFVFFLIFAVLCPFVIIYSFITKDPKIDAKLNGYAYFIASVGLCINGFWLIMGIILFSY
jgi:hypothetical protein